MTDERLTPLLPGIRAIFNRVGYYADIGVVDGKIYIALSIGGQGEVAESKSFSFPTTNKQLSADLLRWRDELTSKAKS